MQIKSKIMKKWLSDNKINLTVVVLILILLFSFKSCMDVKRKGEVLIEAINASKAALKLWEDENGKQHTDMEVVRADKEQMEVIYKGKIDSLSKILKVKDKQIDQFIAIDKVTTGKIITKLVHVYDTLPGTHDTIRITTDYYEAKFADKWLTFNAKISLKDSSFVSDYLMKEKIHVIGYWKRQGFLGLGKKKHYLSINSDNPNSKITNGQNFSIIESPSRIGMGLIGGYGMVIKPQVELRPFVGVGLYYKIF